MKSVSRKEELNDLYRAINDGIDKYVAEWRLDASRVRSYLGRPERAEAFLKSIGLGHFQDARRVLDDVLDDRHYMKSDRVVDPKVVKFESFSIRESSDHRGSGHEHALADHYRTSLDHVIPSSDSKNEYTVEDIGESIRLFVVSEREVEEFADKVRESIRSEVSNADVDLHRLDLGLESGMAVKARMRLGVSDIVDQKKLEQAIDAALTKNRLLFIMDSYINDLPVRRSGKSYEYVARTIHDGEEYHIWRLTDRK